MLRILFIEGTFSRASEPRTVWNRTAKSNVIDVSAAFRRSCPNQEESIWPHVSTLKPAISWSPFLRRFATFHPKYICSALVQRLRTWRTPARSRKDLSKFMSRPLGVRGVNRPYLRSEEHTSELQSLRHLVCRLLLEKKHHVE